MQSADVYGWLMSGGPQSACDRFDAHVVASTLSLAMLESAGERRSLAAAMGLESATVTRLVGHVPACARRLRSARDDRPGCRRPDEACLRQLLVRCTTHGSPFQEQLASIVARRAQRPNHLWQDLGLRNRRELSWLIDRHFEWLAARNARDVSGEFLYRTICRDGSFPICTARAAPHARISTAASATRAARACSPSFAGRPRARRSANPADFSCVSDAAYENGDATPFRRDDDRRRSAFSAPGESRRGSDEKLKGARFCLWLKSSSDERDALDQGVNDEPRCKLQHIARAPRDSRQEGVSKVPTARRMFTRSGPSSCRSTMRAARTLECWCGPVVHAQG